MDEQLKMFEEATSETLKRWKETPGQKANAEENVKYAIIFALNNNFYNGFTSHNGARQKAMQLGEDGIKCALFHNVIQLSDYRHQHADITLGWIDNYITAVSSYCNQGNITDLEEIFNDGLKELADEQQLLQRYNIIDKEQIDIQRSRMREQRERNDKKSQVAYDYANSIVSSYVWYNTYYKMVQTDTEVKTFYDQHSRDSVLNYYQNKKQQTSNMQM